MSTLIRNEKKLWIPVAASVVALGTVAMLLSLRDDTSLRTARPDGPAGAPVAPELPQAPWKIQTVAAAAGSKLTKSDRRIVKKQRPRVATTIRKVYGAVLFDPPALKELTGKHITRAAAATLARSKLTLPKKLSAVETTKRSARVGVDVSSGRRGAARVSVLVKGKIGDKTVKLFHRSTLWLERSEGKWRVIAFDGTRGRRR